MPTEEKKWETAAKIEEKYHLPGFSAGIDGTFLCVDGKPRYTLRYIYKSIQEYFIRVVQNLPKSNPPPMSMRYVMILC